MSDEAEAALPYHEPSITTILIYTSFLLVLNVIDWAIDGVLHCGLVGQILVGVAWGTPGGKLLPRAAEETIVQLGYLGLILIVYEGGLLTSFKSLKANATISLGVALTGVVAPIALSFVLGSLTNASTLQCFAAGAALCSTSLGTTFTVLRSSKLTATRLGVVLTSAAMLDDVLGLVMVQVVSNLGSSGVSVSAVTVLRPILVSIVLAATAVLACRFIVSPATIALNNWRTAHPDQKLACILQHRRTPLLLHTALLLALVAGASYAGTSNLFAAYIAGAVISWWDSELTHLGESREEQPDNQEGRSSGSQHISPHLGCDIFNQFYSPPLRWILQPLFFASIGFSIPVARMFSGMTLWKAVVYAILMAIGKILCGAWLIRFPGTSFSFIKRASRTKSKPKTTQNSSKRAEESALGGQEPVLQDGTAAATLPEDTVTSKSKREQPIESISNTKPRPAKPISLYPALIIGCAMVARGEIGFLISAVAQGAGIFDDGKRTGNSEVFLVTTWAIVLCTILGPLCLGFLVRRLRKLEHEAMGSTDQGRGAWRDAVLGVWGVR